MPPAAKRRRTTSGGPPTASSNTASAKAAQSTLSFRSSKAGARTTDTKKANSNKATTTDHKSTITTDAIDTDGEDALTQQEEELVTQPPAIDIDDPTVRVFQAAEPTKEAEQEEDEEEARLDAKALALSEAKIKGYWLAKERERKAQRVHQQGLTVREKILREFDMSSRYGPSIGITRLARWRRAQNIGMNPPMEVLAVLLKEEQVKPKGEGVLGAHQRSIMDDLILSSRMRDGHVAEI